jgi:hypothetical protein
MDASQLKKSANRLGRLISIHHLFSQPKTPRGFLPGQPVERRQRRISKSNQPHQAS